MIAQFAAHWPAAAKAQRGRPDTVGEHLRPYTTGPHDMPNATTNRLAFYVTGNVTKNRLPVNRWRGAENHRHSAQRDRHARGSTIRSGLRPTLSISAIAINVVRMLVITVR